MSHSDKSFSDLVAKLNAISEGQSLDNSQPRTAPSVSSDPDTQAMADILHRLNTPKELVNESTEQLEEGPKEWLAGAALAGMLGLSAMGLKNLNDPSDLPVYQAMVYAAQQGDARAQKIADNFVLYADEAPSAIGGWVEANQDLVDKFKAKAKAKTEGVETVTEAHRYDTYVNNMFMKMYHMLQTMEEAVKSGGLLDQRIDMIGGINELEGIRNALGKAADEIEEAHMAATAHINEQDKK
jgi:hypothetical protein